MQVNQALKYTQPSMKIDHWQEHFNSQADMMLCRISYASFCHVMRLLKKPTSTPSLKGQHADFTGRNTAGWGRNKAGWYA